MERVLRIIIRTHATRRVPQSARDWDTWVGCKAKPRVPAPSIHHLWFPFPLFLVACSSSARGVLAAAGVSGLADDAFLDDVAVDVRVFVFADIAGACLLCQYSWSRLFDLHIETLPPRPVEWILLCSDIVSSP